MRREDSPNRASRSGPGDEEWLGELERDLRARAEAREDRPRHTGLIRWLLSRQDAGREKRD